MNHKLVQIAAILFLSWLGSVAQADVIHCGRDRYQYKSCATNGYIRRVELRNQLSKTRCDLGNNWGYDSRSIWVDKGCEGNFETFYGGGGGYPPPGHGGPGYGGPGYGGPGYGPGYNEYEEQIICGSSGFRYNTCNTAYGGRIIYLQLIRQQSKSACVEGQSYGATSDSLWVDHGCNGVFRVVTRGY